MSENSNHNLYAKGYRRAVCYSIYELFVLIGQGP